MSRVYFHSPSARAELKGSERAYAGCMVADLARGMFRGMFLSADDSLVQLTRNGPLADLPTSGFGWSAEFMDRFGLHFGSDRGDLLSWRGQNISTFSLALNTAILLGNDQVKFFARLHAQCEIHGYVEGPNRAWLADIMQRGLDSNLYRAGIWYEPARGAEKKWISQGWEEVIALLRSRDDEPVVMSYTVCDSFPNQHTAGWEPPADADDTPTWAKESPDEWAALSEDDRDDYRREARGSLWGDLPDTEKWALAMDGLRRKSETQWLEMKPDNWDDYRFNHELTVLDLQASDWQKRIEDAFDLTPALAGQET